MVVCVECLPADKPWDMVSVTRRSSGVAPRVCVRVYARVLVPPNLYIHTYSSRVARQQANASRANKPRCSVCGLRNRRRHCWALTEGAWIRGNWNWL